MTRRQIRAVAGTAILLLLSWSAAAADELLIGARWSDERELVRLARLVPQVRYVSRGLLLAGGDRGTLAALRAAGVAPFLVDRCPIGESYYLVAYRHRPLADGVRPVYRHPAGWALLRLADDDPHLALPHFLYPLPETYSLRGWLTPDRRRARPVAALDAAEMAAVLASVDRDRLQRDVRRLALLDPEGASVLANLRTRFTVRAETRESTEYLRSELAAVLGADAVEVQEFRVDEKRLDAHLGGRTGTDAVDARAYNVVGVLPGLDPTAGHYVVCGHYDATGVRTPDWDWRTDPAPGADDNATGAALVLEAARVLAARSYPWSIRFIAFSGEELGLLGSKAYAEIAAAEGDEILGVLNFDMFGYNDLTDRVELATNPASRWLADMMVEVNERYGIGLRVDVREDDAARMSDHGSFWARGYDAILAIENYLPTDSTLYAVRQGLYRVNTQYHSTADVPDSINWRLVHKVTQLAVASLAHYVLEEGLPNLAVFPGNLRADGAGNLRVTAGNIGVAAVEEPFTIRVSRCGADSADCEVVHEAQSDGALEPGDEQVATFVWPRLGEALFLLEVDPDGRIPESRETDNRVFQSLYVNGATVGEYPNPYRPDLDRWAVFTGLPSNARVRILSVSGHLVWEAQEDDEEQRGRAQPGEVVWRGVNESGYEVASGVYLYAVTTRDGELLRRGKIAVIR